jgi:NADH:ubiquinone oxidoreductase subunit 4 (subunit M)
MILLSLLLTPLIGIFVVLTDVFNAPVNSTIAVSSPPLSSEISKTLKMKRIKLAALSASIVNLIISLIMFIFFDFSSNQFQFVQEYHEISSFHIFLGVDGLSIYFVLLTTIITPIALLSN